MTHVVWDEFTHVDRWGMRHIPWLAAQHGPWLGVKWAQYTSGVGGVLLLSVLAVALLARRPAGAPRPRRRPRFAPWVVVAPILAGVVVAAWRIPRGGALHDVLYDAVTQGGAAAALVLFVAAGLWHVQPAAPRRRHRRTA